MVIGAKKIIKAEAKAVQEEIRKAKAYFKRTGDRTVAITEEQYLELLEFKLKMLKEVLRQSGETK